MRKILLLTVILGFASIHSQKLNQNIFTDIYSIPSSHSISNYFFFYKIPIHNLIFTKGSGVYSTSVQISVELSDSNTKFIQRYFKERIITYDDFEMTSKPNIYIEGVMPFSLENNSYTVTSRFFDNNSQKEIFVKDQVTQKAITEDVEFLVPIIVEKNKWNCVDKLVRTLPNFGAYVPYNNTSFDILLPCTDTTLQNLYVRVISRNDTIFNSIIVRQNIEMLCFSECSGKVIVDTASLSMPTSIFCLTNLTEKLKEGQFEIIVSKYDDFQDKKLFKPIVKWLNKPKSLSNPESAIKILKFITTDDSVKKILRSGNDNYDSLLYNFWHKIDPSPNTEYNELMAEYYERIDYSSNTFSTITGLNGIETDRAKIYIRYGKPTLIERGTNTSGKISETWVYSKLQQKFTFIDEKGTGEFMLVGKQ